MTRLQEFYRQVVTDDVLNERLELFIAEYRAYKNGRAEPLDILDVGCGENALLSTHMAPEDRYHGTDIKPELDVEIERYRVVDLNEDELTEAFPGTRFDVIFCGEVIEHVFSPDRLLRQLASVMHDESLLILSTPNLAYWVNRILLPLGINPMFLENSSEVKLGRRFAALGQGNTTQGHIRVFTHVALLELLEREGFEIRDVKAVPVWGIPVDRLVCKYSHKLAPGNVYLLRKRQATGRVAPAETGTA